MASPAVSGEGTVRAQYLNFLSAQRECVQLHASSEAAEKMEGQLKWQNQKQQRQVELERHVLQQRELTCVRHERRGQQFDERLLARSNAVDGDRVEIDNARAVHTAELHSAREAQLS
jgi:hypothetical protein